MSLVVASKVKDLVKKHGCHSSGDLGDACSAMVEHAVEKACKRAEGNGRKTVRPVDL
jgi:histone H3/H4